MINIQMSIFFTVWLAVGFGLPVAMVVLDKLLNGKWYRYLVHYTFNGGTGTSYIIWRGEITQEKLLNVGKQIEDKLGIEKAVIANIVKLERVKSSVYEN